MDIVFKGRHTDVLERFRKHATAKLTKIERLHAKAIRVDVEVTTERNPRQSGRKDRVELTITSSGPAIRAEAAAEDRFAALDLALAKLESRLRRAADRRRKGRHSGQPTVRLTEPPGVNEPAADAGPASAGSDVTSAIDDQAGGSPDDDAAEAGGGERRGAGRRGRARRGVAGRGGAGRGGPARGNSVPIEVAPDDFVPIEMEGDGPLVVREKFHAARPMAIDQALLEMELVGHDFFLFRDAQGGIPSVVYRRRGYQYGVIRLVEQPAGNMTGDLSPAAAMTRSAGLANGKSAKAAKLQAG